MNTNQDAKVTSPLTEYALRQPMSALMEPQ